MVLWAILGLGLLMVVHEAGHYFLARLYGMRVLKFSIGFGPVLWSKTSEKSGTTYQVALLPFLAYVQIAGMNPHEEYDPDDKGSYMNASWTGRILTILAGPVANYLFAVIVFFFLLVIAGRPTGIDGLKVGLVAKGGPAEQAHVMVGDEVKAIDGLAVNDWQAMRQKIIAHKGVEMTLVVDRGGTPVTLKVTPSAKDGRIGIGPKELRRSVSVREAARDAVVEPPRVAASFVVGFGRLILRKEKLELKGPVGIVEEAKTQLQQSVEQGVEFFAILSIYICVFNLVPFPALDGGRVAFLLYEFVARRRPDAKVEARVHMVGLLTMLAIFIPLFFFELWKELISKLFVKS